MNIHVWNVDIYGSIFSIFNHGAIFFWPWAEILQSSSVDCLPYLTFTQWIASLTWHLLSGLPPLPDICSVDCLPYLTFTQWIASLSWHLLSGLLPLPDTKWTLHRHPQQGAGVPGEDVTDLVPVDGGQEVGVGRVLDPLLQIQHAAHQDL